VEAKLEKFAQGLSIQNMAITYVPDIDDKETEMDLNNINAKTKTTLIVYNKRKVFDKFVDFTATDKNFNLLFSSVDETGRQVEQ
jgi:protocatechuate 3,4-dioxygenase beta subunit